MAFDRWRIGMDMEPDVLHALALSRERAQWRCRGWWQFPLPMGRDEQGDPCPVAATVDALRRWHGTGVLMSPSPARHRRAGNCGRHSTPCVPLRGGHPRLAPCRAVSADRGPAPLWLALALIAMPAAYWRHQRLTLEIRLAETHPLPEAPQVRPIASAAALSASTARTTQCQCRLAIANQRYVHLFRQLPALSPPQLWLTEIEQRGDRLYISGCSEGYPPVVTLRRRLTDHATLPDFRWREVRRRDASRWQFSLVAT